MMLKNKIMEIVNKILSFDNKKIDGSIINDDQIKNLVFFMAIYVMKQL